MEGLFSRFFEDLVDRVTGPMKFRLILQPVTAIIFGVRSGLQDAKEGKPPYFWTLFTDPTQRADMLRDGWKSIGRVFVLAIVIDVIYQIIVSRRFHAAEAIVVAALLAIVPYLLVRGPITRISRRNSREKIE